jgi:DNA-binding MarR family transcriptional regulator
MSRWLTEEEQRAWRGLLRMTSRLNARMNRQLQDDYRISLADYDVLVVLSEAPAGRLRVFGIADALAWEQSRVSHQLARMQRRGLVTREQCRADARGAFVVLGEAGRAAIERAAPAHVETVRRLVFDGLSRDQLTALTEVTSHVLERLGEPADIRPNGPAFAPSRGRHAGPDDAAADGGRKAAKGLVTTRVRSAKR